MLFGTYQDSDYLPPKTPSINSFGPPIGRSHFCTGLGTTCMEDIPGMSHTIFTHIHTHTYTHTHTRIFTHIRTYSNTLLHTHTHTCIQKNYTHLHTLARRQGSSYARGAAQPLGTSSQAPCGRCKAAATSQGEPRPVYDDAREKKIGGRIRVEYYCLLKTWPSEDPSELVAPKMI